MLLAPELNIQPGSGVFQYFLKMGEEEELTLKPFNYSLYQASRFSLLPVLSANWSHCRSPLRNAFQPRLQDADHLGPGRTLSFRGLLQAHMVGGTHGGLRAAVQGRSGSPMPQGPSQPTPPLPGLLRPGHPSGPPGCLVTMCSQLPPPLPASASLQTH